MTEWQELYDFIRVVRNNRTTEIIAKGYRVSYRKAVGVRSEGKIKMTINQSQFHCPKNREGNLFTLLTNAVNG